jgi:hypothetical protein
MSVAANIAKDNPELMDELRLVVTEHPGVITAGIRLTHASRSRSMKKIVVIGSGGSGKSMFSQELGEITGLPVIHLDKLFWRPNWTRTPEEEWLEIVRP